MVIFQGRAPRGRLGHGRIARLPLVAEGGGPITILHPTRSSGAVRPVARRAVLLLFLSAAALAAGCAGASRKQAAPPGDVAAVPIAFPSGVRIADDSRRAFELRAPRVLERVRTAAGNGPVHVLALSGGGAGAAFGAGALVGWTGRGTRPDFEIVTGVSSGALIAPFAFLGPAWDEQLTDIFSGERTKKLLQPHWLTVLFHTSVYRGKPLHDLVDRYVTDELLRAVAAEAAKGRQLLVATTDLDKEQTVIWNLGVIAAQGGEGARRLFRDVIIASSSIPGVYPPVIIRVARQGAEFDEMHVDGGTTSALFIAPEVANMLPFDAETLHGAEVYIIVNGQFGASTRTTPVRLVPIVQRSLSTLLQSTSRAAVEVAAGLTQRSGMQLRVTQIPNEYPYSGPLDVEPVRMRALYDYGVRCALQGQLWATPVELLDRLEISRRTPPDAVAECPAPGNHR